MDQNLSLMNQLMQEITMTKEWDQRLANDPAVSTAEDRWETALERAKSILPTDLYSEREDAHAGELAATGDAAILYGIHVVYTIRDVAANPAELSRYIITKRKGVAHP